MKQTSEKTNTSVSNRDGFMKNIRLNNDTKHGKQKVSVTVMA